MCMPCGAAQCHWCCDWWSLPCLACAALAQLLQVGARRAVVLRNTYNSPVAVCVCVLGHVGCALEALAKCKVQALDALTPSKTGGAREWRAVLWVVCSTT